MAFMVPTAEFFTKADCVEQHHEALRCEDCGRMVKRTAALLQDVTRCLECEPPAAGWYGRLSADGYMDCTDWDGPHDTAADAIAAVCEIYECDADGEPLEDHA